MELRAGYADADLTPPGECDLNGFIARTQPALGVGKPVMARVLMVEAGRFRALVAVCDLLGFSQADSRRIEEGMGAAAGVPAANVLLACTHTHSAPVAMYLGTVGRFRPAYVDRCRRRLVGAARGARRDLASVAGARFARGDASDLGAFRCATDEPGRDRWPGRFAALRLDRGASPPIVFVHMGVHPYVVGPQYRYVHPDYPGDLCGQIEARAGARALFLPGCGADIRPQPCATDSPEAVTRYGGTLAARALDALGAGRRIELLPARGAVASPLLRFDCPRPEELREAAAAAGGSDPRIPQNAREWAAGVADGSCPKSLRFRTHVLRLGGLVLIGMPAELFWDTGEDLSRALPGAEVLTVSHAGGDVGYLPRPFAYKHRTYEACDAPRWYRTAGPPLPTAERAMRAAAAKAARLLLA